MNRLVLGAGRFIGPHLVEDLPAWAHTVALVDVVSAPAPEITMRGLGEVLRGTCGALTGEEARSKATGGEAFYHASFEGGTRALGWASRHGLRETVRETTAYYPRAAARAGAA